MTAPQPETRGEYVDRFYEMDPTHEDLCFGTDLREGMIVLLEDTLFRADISRIENPYDRAKAREVNRWATVTQLRFTDRFPASPLVRFVALYADGTKAVRTYSAEYAWIFKKDAT